MSAGLAHGVFHLLGDVRFGSGSWILVVTLLCLCQTLQSHAQKDEGGESPLHVHRRDRAKGTLILTPSPLPKTISYLQIHSVPESLRSHPMRWMETELMQQSPVKFPKERSSLGGVGVGITALDIII